MEAVGLNINDITIDRIKNFASLKTPKERLDSLLVQYKAAHEKRRSGISKKSVVLEFFSDNLWFSIGLGISWEQVKVYLLFIEKLLMETAVKGLDLDDAQKFLKTLATTTERSMPTSYIISAVEFLQRTFFQHYLLYQYFFTHEQDELVSNEMIVLEVPCPSITEMNPVRSIPPLKDGIQHDQWIKEKKIEELNKKWQVVHQEREKKNETKRDALQKGTQECITKLDMNMQEKNKEAFSSSLTNYIRDNVALAFIDIEEEWEAFAEGTLQRLERAGFEKTASEHNLKPRSKSRAKKSS